MKNFLLYIKHKPLAFISLIIILILYLIMIFAEFNAPYSQVSSHPDKTYHPPNLKIVRGKLVAQEARVINTYTWKYVMVKNYYHKISFFVKGEEYKLFGLISTSIHLFGTENNAYPVFVLGADNLGRDLFSRIIYGSRISLTIGFVATFISLLLAIIFGGLSGYYGGMVDWSIMRISEFFMLIPGLYLILFLRSLLSTNMDSGQSYMIITLILSLVGWPGSARTIRGLIHSIKREEFVLNAQLEGTPSFIIIFSYIIPQMASLLIVSTALSIPGFIMSETTLSYLGLGISDPAVSWGSLIKRDVSTLSNLINYPWLLNPVWLLLIVTLVFNFLGDALRDYFDPYNIIFPKLFGRKRNKLTECKTNNVYSDDYLTIKNLKVDFLLYQNKKEIKLHAVRGISYSLQKGKVLGIVGESGSGKSVSSMSILGLLPDNSIVNGEIILNGKNLLTLSPTEMRNIRGKRIGLILQEPSRSFDPLQNIENVFYETLRNSDKELSKENARSKTLDLLLEVGLTNPEERLKNFPHQFSGGQLQRISIALALAQNCELLIADEPTTALDVTIQMQIINLIKNIQKKRDLTIIFISHNISLISQISDEIIVMYGGMIMEHGKTTDIMNNPVHQYTKALLASLPKFGMNYRTGLLESIPGKILDAKTEISGCPYYERCSVSNDSCKKNDYLEKSCYERK